MDVLRDLWAHMMLAIDALFFGRVAYAVYIVLATVAVFLFARKGKGDK